MSYFATSEDKVVVEEYQEEESEILHIGSEGGGGDTADEGGYQHPRPPGGGSVMEVEKRIRREIANSNERRRMQSINAGFQSLRTLLPHHEGEKLSKAAILQQTAEYIYSLEQEKTRLLSQNCQLKRLVNQHEGGDLPAKKRRMHILSHHQSANHQQNGIDDTETTLLGLSSPEPEEVRAQLEQERRMRAVLEDRVRELEARVYSTLQQGTAPQTGGYIHRVDVIEHTNNVTMQEPKPVQRLEDEMLLVPAENLPQVALTQTVVTLPMRSPSPTTCIVKEESRPPTPILHDHILTEAVNVSIKAEKIAENQTIMTLSTPLSMSCTDDDIIEEDKNSSASSQQARPYLSGNKTRQNLETIVEAIRHLEGDHMFDDRSLLTHTASVPAIPTQDAPLALTTTPKQHPTHLILRPNISPNSIATGNTTYAHFQRQQQCRPGVIVVKQQS